MYNAASVDAGATLLQGMLDAERLSKLGHDVLDRTIYAPRHGVGA
jgi:hypothetical protein